MTSFSSFMIHGLHKAVSCKSLVRNSFLTEWRKSWEEKKGQTIITKKLTYSTNKSVRSVIIFIFNWSSVAAENNSASADKPPTSRNLFCAYGNCRTSVDKAKRDFLRTGRDPSTDSVVTNRCITPTSSAATWT